MRKRSAWTVFQSTRPERPLVAYTRDLERQARAVLDFLEEYAPDLRDWPTPARLDDLLRRGPA